MNSKLWSSIRTLIKTEVVLGITRYVTKDPETVKHLEDTAAVLEAEIQAQIAEIEKEANKTKLVVQRQTKLK